MFRSAFLVHVAESQSAGQSLLRRCHKLFTSKMRSLERGLHEIQRVSVISSTEAKLFDRALTRYRIDTESVQRTSSDLRRVVECLTESDKNRRQDLQVKHMVFLGQLMQRLEELYPQIAPKIIIPDSAESANTATNANAIAAVEGLIESVQTLPEFLKNGEADILVELKTDLEGEKYKDKI